MGDFFGGERIKFEVSVNIPVEIWEGNWIYDFRIQGKGLGWTFKFGSCWPKVIILRAMRLDDLTKEKYR